ncbi:MAG TPA: ABC transporter substrate-binding protein [Longimicrobium sp.]
MNAGCRIGIAVLGLMSGACGGMGAGGEIHVGLAGSMGTAGGRAVRQAAEMAVEEINARGGIEGRRLALVVKDDAGDPRRAIQVATELRDDARVVAVIGHINSAATLAAAGGYNHPRRGVVALSPTASSPQVTQAGPWTFRVSPSDLAYGPALARWARAHGVRRAAVLYANDEYGRGVEASFAGAFRAEGGAVVSQDPYLTEMLTVGAGAEPYLRRALNRGMDALFIAGSSEDAAAILPRVRRLGYTGPVIGADGLLGVEAEGAVAEGVFIGAAFFADAGDQAAGRFVAEYQRRFRLPPNADAALGYDAMRVIEQALTRAGPGRAHIRTYLEGIGTANPAVEGVTGAIRFDRNGDVPQKVVAVGVVRGGNVVSAGR